MMQIKYLVSRFMGRNGRNEVLEFIDAQGDEIYTLREQLKASQRTIWEQAEKLSRLGAGRQKDVLRIDPPQLRTGVSGLSWWHHQLVGNAGGEVIEASRAVGA
jgi:hypothetical protein